MFSFPLRSRVASVCTSFPRARFLSSSLPRRSERAVVFSLNGPPGMVLKVLTFPSLPPPAPGTVNIRFQLSPVNPADINVIEGVYPVKPAPVTGLAEIGEGSEETPVFICGNEGLATVTSVGENTDGLQVGDRVVMVRPQAGTWVTSRNVGVNDVVKVPSSLPDVNAATISVNPPTAWNMLSDFTKLEEGDWVMQNGANSAVGQAVIQIAAARGLNTLNFIRNRHDTSELKEKLKNLGATEVITYDDMDIKSTREKIKRILDGKQIRLALNCIGGKKTTLMLKYLGQDGHLVTYGGMSKDPFQFFTSSFIFKNMKAHGFWQSQWYRQHSHQEREDLLQSLAQLTQEGKLQAPDHEIVSIGKGDDKEATKNLRKLFQRIAKGRYNNKILLKFEE